MTEFHLISHHLCPYVQRAVIVLEEKNIAHKRTYIDLADKPDWFATMSPLGKVPVLEAGGAVLFESQVIAEYLDEITVGSLHSDDPLEKARHRAWIEYGSQTLNAIAGLYYAKSEAEYADKHDALAAMFERILQEVEGPYFAGSSFHLIDGVWGTIFRYLDVFEAIDGFQPVSKSGKLKKWRAAVMKRKSIAAAVPEGYGGRLLNFLANRGTFISTMIGNTP